MINAILDIITFLKSNFGFLFALMLYLVLAIALAKSIKKNYKVYYWVFGIISFSFIISSLSRLLGFSLPFNFSSLPIIGLCSSELSSAANFIHPVIVIIMFMGAFDVKTKYVGRLMSIRKELSIIVGFPVLAHTVKRLFGTFPGGWDYFANHQEYIQSPKVTSVLGSGITSFAFVLGLFMAILFLVLWITSFDSVRRKMGQKRWKSVQKWSYGLYAMLFIHALCLQLGGLISDKAREARQQPPRTEMVAEANHGHNHGGNQPQVQQGGHSKEQPQAQQGQGQAGQPQAKKSGHGHGPKSFSFADVEISKSTKRVLNMVILFAIYGSYLVLRLRKAKRDRLKKASRA